MADGLFTKGIEQIGLGNVAIETDTFKLAPMSTAYTPDYDAHQFWSDVSASIASGASAITLTSVTFNIGTLKVAFDSADVSETSQTWTSDKFVIYKDTGVAATSPLIGCMAFDTTQTPVSGTFTFTVPAGGFFSIASA